jgi:hypothetical protein
MTNLEQMLDTHFRLIQKEYRDDLPKKIDLLPHDGNPNGRHGNGAGAWQATR